MLTPLMPILTSGKKYKMPLQIYWNAYDRMRGINKSHPTQLAHVCHSVSSGQPDSQLRRENQTLRFIKEKKDYFIISGSLLSFHCLFIILALAHFHFPLKLVSLESGCWCYEGLFWHKREEILCSEYGTCIWWKVIHNKFLIVLMNINAVHKTVFLFLNFDNRDVNTKLS